MSLAYTGGRTFLIVGKVPAKALRQECVSCAHDIRPEYGKLWGMSERKQGQTIVGPHKPQLRMLTSVSEKESHWKVLGRCLS